MKVVITGATGLIGRHLTRALAARGDAVVALTRGNTSVPGALTMRWKGSGSLPTEAWRGADAIVNLAGRSIGEGRWTDEQRREIVRSRVRATRACVEALGRNGGPRALVNASAIGYYGPTEKGVTESAPAGSDFPAEVCIASEAEARKGEERGAVTRVRTGIVLARDGGALPRLLLPARLGLGGPMGGGKQWQSWIHIDDEVGILLYLLDHDIRGAVNAVAPAPVRQREFAEILGATLHRPAFIPTPAFALRLALGGPAVMALEGQKVIPSVISKSGYEFRFPRLAGALQDLLRPSR